MTSWTERQELEEAQHEETFQSGVAEGRRQVLKILEEYSTYDWQYVKDKLAEADTPPEENSK